MKIPHYQQETEYTCGPTCMRMVLSSLGIKKSEDWLARFMHVSKKYGIWHKYIPFVAEKFKLDYVVQRDGSVSQLRKFMGKNWRIIVCYRANDGVGHYSVIKRIGLFKIELLDPYKKQINKMSILKFKKVWYDSENYLPWFAAIKRSRGNKHLHIQNFDLEDVE